MMHMMLASPASSASLEVPLPFPCPPIRLSLDHDGQAGLEEPPAQSRPTPEVVRLSPVRCDGDETEGRCRNQKGQLCGRVTRNTPASICSVHYPCVVPVRAKSCSVVASTLPDPLSCQLPLRGYGVGNILPGGCMKSPYFFCCVHFLHKVVIENIKPFLSLAPQCSLPLHGHGAGSNMLGCCIKPPCGSVHYCCVAMVRAPPYSVGVVASTFPTSVCSVRCPRGSILPVVASNLPSPSVVFHTLAES